MSIQLKSEDLINTQQMAVAINGPDGATHLILCTGLASLGGVCDETYTFLVGPEISRRQFVGAIASCALSTFQSFDTNPAQNRANVELGPNLILVDADYDDESGQVKVRAEVSSSQAMTKLAISYNVSILAELPGF